MKKAKAAAPLTIVHVDAEQGFSGGEVQVLLLMEGLRSRGHRCVLIAPPHSQAEAAAHEGGFETNAVGMRNDLDLIGVLRLEHALRAVRPDVVHLHTGRATWLGGLAAHLAHRPAITTRRMDARVKRGWRTQLVYRLLTCKAAAISRAVAERLEAGGVNSSRIVMVPDAIDLRRIEPCRGRAATRASLGLSDEIVLLSLAALVRRKGLDVLVEAVARLKQGSTRVHVLLAGEGPEHKHLQEAVDRAGLSACVRILGQRPDVGDLLAACDVFVLPARNEGMGVAALEAMAAARPVIATSVGGLAEAVVPEITGLLVPPDDAGALSLAIARLCADAALRERLGRAGAARVCELYLADRMVDAYERMYADAIASGPKFPASSTKP